MIGSVLASAAHILKLERYREVFIGWQRDQRYKLSIVKQMMWGSNAQYGDC